MLLKDFQCLLYEIRQVLVLALRIVDFVANID